ncbi:hypothetical protein V6N13_038461 [Hibiscus sabdariffa]
MGVRHLGLGSKIILTSRDRQALYNGGADKIHEVKKLNVDHSLQLFSTFAFKQLNPAADFRDLSNKFIEYAQEMGKEIIIREVRDPQNRSRLWRHKDVHSMLKHSEGSPLTIGIKLDMSQINTTQLCPTVFQNMHNLRFIYFYDLKHWNKKLLADQVDIVYLPDELRYLYWENYPFRSLSSNFNPSNLAVLKLPYGEMEQLWNEDYGLDLVNLRKIDLYHCKNLRKIPNLSGAIHLEILCCYGCQRLVELPCLDHMSSLKRLELQGCHSLKKFPQVPNHFPSLYLVETGVEEVPDSVEHLVRLEKLSLEDSMVKNISTNISKMESLRFLDLSHCLIAKFPEKTLTQIEEAFPV